MKKYSEAAFLSFFLALLADFVEKCDLLQLMIYAGVMSHDTTKWLEKRANNFKFMLIQLGRKDIIY